MNLDYLSRTIIDPQPVIDNTDSKFPDFWRILFHKEQQERKSIFLKEGRFLFENMPLTFQFLEKFITDAYIIKTKNDYRFIIDRKSSDEEIISYQSFCPEEGDFFGGSVGSFYSVLNGFCDMHFFGGMLPIHRIKRLDEGEFYEEPSLSIYNQYKNSDYVEVFNDGGKGRGYLSRGSTFQDAPLAMTLWVDDDKPMTQLEFWNFIDNWTEIAMQA